MPKYTLSFDDDGTAGERHVQFEAHDPAGALRVAQREKRGRSAILWQGDTKLCRLELRATGPSSDVWIIGPALAHQERPATGNAIGEGGGRTRART
jgi:hypothetical protein